jgi:hypothetical protein
LSKRRGWALTSYVSAGVLDRSTIRSEHRPREVLKDWEKAQTVKA